MDHAHVAVRTAGQVLVDSLVAAGIDRVFCVPGESYLGLLDALYGRDDIDTVVCRHEAGAGFMALADARLTHRPGVACVSRGPGASNAAIAVHTAQQDAVPFLLLVGQVAARDLRRDAFQEVDYQRMFGGIAKWVTEITDPARIGETMLRALQVATTGTPGPVVVALPEDVLTAATNARVADARVADARIADARVAAPQATVRAAPAEADLDLLRTWLGQAQRPLVLAGSAMQQHTAALHSFLEAWNLPLLVSFRRQDLFDNRHRLYAGDMGLSNPATQMHALHRADLLLVLGARLSDITTQGYTFPSAATRLVHVHPDPAAIGTHFPTHLAIACHPAALLDALEPFATPPARDAWLAQLAAERRRLAAPRQSKAADGVPFEDVVDIVGRTLPEDGILTLDAGTFAAPAYRIIPFRPPQRLLAPIAGSMGFGVPAAVAAALRCPGRPVICMVGDGGFLMTGNELAVAMERRLPLKVIVSVNGSYGSIRINQERAFPGRVIGTGLTNPDFALIGQAFGFPVVQIRTRDDLQDLPGHLQAPGPTFIVVTSSLAAVLP